MSNNPHKISVIMATYNSAKTLEDSINSVLRQTYNNLEFLILDDSSDDKTYEILNQYKTLDSRIKIFTNNRNLGLTKSLNLLLKEAKGYFIARQDADDRSHPERLQTQINHMVKYNLDFSTTRALRMETSKKIPGLSHYLPCKMTIKYKNPFIHGSLMIKKSTINDIGNYDEAFYFAQDFKLFSDLLEANRKYKIINNPLYSLNTEDNISTKFKDEQKHYADCVRKKIKPVNL